MTATTNYKIMKLTEHFDLAEFTASTNAKRFGIDNKPTAEHIENMRALCVNILEPLRQMWGGAIEITSGYRCAELNAKTNGASSTSQHCKGEAADLKPANGDTLGLFRVLKNSGLRFDQLINEYPDANGVPSWVHVSFTTKRKNRGQVLIIGAKK